MDSADEESGSDEEEDERGSPGRTPVTGKTVRFSEMEEVLEFDSEDRRMSTGSYGTWSTSSSHGDASFGSCDRKRSFEEGSSGGEVDDAGQASEDESTVSTVDELIDEVEALYNGDVFGGVSVGQVAAPSKSAAFDANPTLHFPPSPPFPHLSPTKPILHPQRSIDYSGPESDIRGLFRTSSASSGAGSLSQSASEARDGQDLPLRLPSLPRIIFPSLPPLSLPSTPPPKSAAVVPNRLATPIRPARRPTTSGSLARQGRRISIGEEDTVGEKQRRRIPRRSVSVGGIRESANGQDSDPRLEKCSLPQIGGLAEMVVDTDDFAVGVESSLDYSVKEETPSYCQRVSERSIVYADDGEVASGGVAGDIQVWRKKRSSDAHDFSSLNSEKAKHPFGQVFVTVVELRFDLAVLPIPEAGTSCECSIKNGHKKVSLGSSFTLGTVVRINKEIQLTNFNRWRSQSSYPSHTPRIRTSSRLHRQRHHLSRPRRLEAACALSSPCPRRRRKPSPSRQIPPSRNLSSAFAARMGPSDAAP